jgi:hypothetical protein
MTSQKTSIFPELRKSPKSHKKPQKATKGHKTPQKATKRHKRPQKATNFTETLRTAAPQPWRTIQSTTYNPIHKTSIHRLHRPRSVAGLIIDDRPPQPQRGFAQYVSPLGRGCLVEGVTQLGLVVGQKCLTVAQYQTLLPMEMSPMTEAEGATKAAWGKWRERCRRRR